MSNLDNMYSAHIKNCMNTEDGRKFFEWVLLNSKICDILEDSDDVAVHNNSLNLLSKVEEISGRYCQVVKIS